MHQPDHQRVLLDLETQSTEHSRTEGAWLERIFICPETSSVP